MNSVVTSYNNFDYRWSYENPIVSLRDPIPAYADLAVTCLAVSSLGSLSKFENKWSK